MKLILCAVMSNFDTNMAFLDDTNGNTVNINQPGDVTTTGTELSLTTLHPASMLHSPSNDDLSQSLSEYTDADESISAPTELLAEFLSAIMIRDYVMALKYCKQILQYEPNNTTARDFYPHILSKISKVQNQEFSGESDENYNFNYSSPLASFPSSASSSSVHSQSSYTTSYSSENNSNEIYEAIMACSADNYESSDVCCSLPGSVSIDEHDDEEKNEEDDKSGKGVTVFAGTEVVAEIDLLEQPQSSQSVSGQSPFAGKNINLCNIASSSLTDNNTSHSYSSLLLEDEEKDLTMSDISNLHIEEDETSNECDGSAENSSTSCGVRRTKPGKTLSSNAVVYTNITSASALASKLVAMLRSKVTPSKSAKN